MADDPKLRAIVEKLVAKKTPDADIRRVVSRYQVEQEVQANADQAERANAERQMWARMIAQDAGYLVPPRKQTDELGNEIGGMPEGAGKEFVKAAVQNPMWQHAAAPRLQENPSDQDAANADWTSLSGIGQHLKRFATAGGDLLPITNPSATMRGMPVGLPAPSSNFLRGLTWLGTRGAGTAAGALTGYNLAPEDSTTKQILYPIIGGLAGFGGQSALERLPFGYGDQIASMAEKAKAWNSPFTVEGRTARSLVGPMGDAPAYIESNIKDFEDYQKAKRYMGIGQPPSAGAVAVPPSPPAVVNPPPDELNTAVIDAYKAQDRANRLRKIGEPPILRKPGTAPPSTPVLSPMEGALNEIRFSNTSTLPEGAGTLPPEPSITPSGREGEAISSGRPGVTQDRYDEIVAQAQAAQEQSRAARAATLSAMGDVPFTETTSVQTPPPTSGPAAPVTSPATAPTTPEISFKDIRDAQGKKMDPVNAQKVLDKLRQQGAIPGGEIPFTPTTTVPATSEAPMAPTGEGDPDLVARNKQAGAEKIARQEGMTTEEMRKERGSLEGEEEGAARERLPTNSVNRMVDAMREMPYEGSERQAYIDKGNSVKARTTGSVTMDALARNRERLGQDLLGNVADASKESGVTLSGEGLTPEEAIAKYRDSLFNKIKSVIPFAVPSALAARFSLLNGLNPQPDMPTPPPPPPGFSR